MQTKLISIILPIRNEANFIKKSLESILDQDFPQDQIEVLIADGMSTDGTREIVRNYQQIHTNIYLIDNPKQIVPTALNAAIRQAKGDIIIRVDGHTRIASDYVRKCTETLHRTDADNAGGCMTAVGSNAFGEAVSIATSTPFGVGNSKFHYAKTEEEADSVYMGAWPKDLFSRIGLFDEELVRDQDDEFNYRLREKGGKIILNPDIKSVYTTRGSPFSLWKQYFQYGYWKVRVLQKHPKQMSLRQFVPLSFVLALLLTLMLTVMTSWGWISLIGLVCMYLFANLIASILTVSGQSTKKLLLLPVAFTIIHISYGLGFLIGLFRFWNRWKDKAGKVPFIKYSS